MSERCFKCFRSVQNCLCSYINPIDPGVKFVILMHPQEAYKQKTGTGRLTGLSIIGSEIIVDKVFDNNSRVQNLINSKEYYPMVLYPGKNVHYAETFNFNTFSENRTLLIFLIDATWDRARKMMLRSKTLQKLPKLSFSREYRSNFRIKRQPADYCLSTIESSYYLIKELQNSNICNPDIDLSGLMSVFERMVDYQLKRKEMRMLENKPLRGVR